MRELWLVISFGWSLWKKLRSSERKYRWQHAWLYFDRRDLVAHLMHHIEKGDPRDVAIYCAFAWYHGYPVTPDAETPTHVAILSQYSYPAMVQIMSPLSRPNLEKIQADVPHAEPPRRGVTTSVMRPAQQD